jgi:hypothetical protein
VTERLSAGPSSSTARAHASCSTHPSRQVSSLIVVPLKMRDRLLGFVSTVSLTASRRFDEGQRKLLDHRSRAAAAIEERTACTRTCEATFQQTIQSLARTIDKMDRYTAGPLGARGALYAVALARCWACPKIRSKSSSLAPDARHRQDRLRDEPEQGRQADAGRVRRSSSANPSTAAKSSTRSSFLGPVIPGVYLHHERWDGRVTRSGLAATTSRLIARIISVADTYDAMTSDRAYRRALPHEVTVSEIERCSGTQFDPDIAGTFTERIELLREELRATGHEPPE